MKTFRRWCKLAKRVAMTPATTPEGLIAKITLIASGYPEDDFDGTYDGILASAALDAQALMSPRIEVHTNASTDRRTMLRGLSALTAGAAASVTIIPAIADADPVLGLVEAHKAAWARLLELEDHTDDYETLEEAGRAVDAAVGEIMKIPPTAPAGTRVVIEHPVECDKDGARETSGRYLATLLRSPLLAD
jgi:hypothetical protein